MPVLKMLSRRQVSAIEHTLNYITREAGNAMCKPLLHNLRSSSNDHKGIVQEFITNEAYRKITSNRVYCYHSILSLSDLDRQHATPEVMEALVQKYLELRGDIIAVAVPHFDTNSPHIHVLESGTMYRENKASGLRKSELHRLKTELELFVKERLPELEHSQVVHGRGGEYVKEAEYQLQKRTGTSERAHLKILVQNAYRTATSKQQFLENLLDHGYAYYERNSDGVPTGVVSESGRKYRFKTLGLLPEKIIELESPREKRQEQQLFDQLKNLRQNNNPKNREL